MELMLTHSQPPTAGDTARHVFDNEISALQRTLERLEPGLSAAVARILRCGGKVVVTGIGKSGIIGHKISATLASTGTPSLFLNAGEALHGDLGVIARDDVVLMVSNSATTPELSRLVPSIRRIGAGMIGIFGTADTRLAKEVDCRIDASIKQEACPLGLAPMTSTTVALVIGDALAAALIAARKFTPEQFAVFHPGGALGRRLLYRVTDVMRDPGPARIGLDATLGGAVEGLAAGEMGAAVMVDAEGKVAGILTEGDVRRAFLSKTDPETPIREVMTRNPKVVAATATLGEALDLMERDRRVYVLPVADGEGKLTGILRMHDVVG